MRSASATFHKGFFAPGNDASGLLTGWYPDIARSQLAASDATDTNEWWPVARHPILDLQAALDPFRPRETAKRAT